MTSRIYCKNRHIVARDPLAKRAAAQSDEVEFLGRKVAVQRGHASPGGVLLPASAAGSTVSTSTSCHELDVVASDPATGLVAGDRVLVYLGGDDGEVSATGISAFVPVEGAEHVVVHEKYIWARITPGGVAPLGRIVLTARNDAAFHRHVLGPGASAILAVPEAQSVHGARATGRDGDDREIAAVTALYETVRRAGPKADVAEGAVLCFSPSYSATRLDIDGRQFHLVDSAEAYFTIDG